MDMEYLFDRDRADEAERLLASYPDLSAIVWIVDEAHFVIIMFLAKKKRRG